MHGEEETSTQSLDVEIPEIDDSAGPAEQRLWKLAKAAAERGDKVAWERLNAAFRRLEAMRRHAEAKDRSNAWNRYHAERQRLSAQRRQAEIEDRETAAELGRD